MDSAPRAAFNPLSTLFRAMLPTRIRLLLCLLPLLALPSAQAETVPLFDGKTFRDGRAMPNCGVCRTA